MGITCVLISITASLPFDLWRLLNPDQPMVIISIQLIKIPESHSWDSDYIPMSHPLPGEFAQHTSNGLIFIIRTVVSQGLIPDTHCLASGSSSSAQTQYQQFTRDQVVNIGINCTSIADSNMLMISGCGFDEARLLDGLNLDSGISIQLSN